MKKRLLGAIIALGGSALAVGTAFALYTGSLPENKTISISTKTSADVSLVASVKSDSETVLSPASRERLVTFNAGFTKNANSHYAQDYFFAHLEFKLTSTSKDLIKAMDTNSWVKLGTQTTQGKTYGTYWGWDSSIENPNDRFTKANHLNGNNAHISTDELSVSWAVDYPLFEGENVSEFEFHIRLDDEIAGVADFVDLAEESFNIELTVSEVAESAYVVGNATGDWNDKGEFMMVPNAKYNGTPNDEVNNYEWMYKTGTDANAPNKLIDGEEYKLHKGSSYCCGNDNHIWSYGENNDNGKVFYWVVGSEHFSLGTL